MERGAPPLNTVHIMSEDTSSKKSAKRHHHLTPLEKRAIFDARAHGATVLDLAALYKVSRQTIYNVIRDTSKDEACTTGTRNMCGGGASPQKQKRSRRIAPEIRTAIEEIKRKYPSWGVAYIKGHWIKAGHAPVSIASIYRILRDAGLQTRAQVEKEVYQRFEMTRPGQLWQMDIQGKIHLPGIGWVHGFAILDDYSRFSPGFRYFTDEKMSNGILVLNDAINKHGVPDKMYLDNGSQFKSKGERLNNFELFCAANAIDTTNTEPGRPQGKGKIERLYETVENQFITWVRVKIKEAPPSAPYTVDDLNRDLAAYLQDDYHARVHGGTNETPASRFFKESLRKPDPPVDVVKFLERVTTRQVNKFGEISFNGYKIQVALPGHSHVKVVETIETVRIEQGESLIREINKKELSKEPPIKRQTPQVKAPKQAQQNSTTTDVDFRTSHARSRARRSPIVRKSSAYDPDESGIYHRTVLHDGRFAWKHHKYMLGLIHANKKISILVSGDELVVHDEAGNLVANLMIRSHHRIKRSRMNEIDVNDVNTETSKPILPFEAPHEDKHVVNLPKRQPKNYFEPDNDGLYTRQVESTGKVWWHNIRYHFSKKYAGMSIRLRVVENTLQILDEEMNPIKILKIREKSPKDSKPITKVY